MKKLILLILLIGCNWNLNIASSEETSTTLTVQDIEQFHMENVEYVMSHPTSWNDVDTTYGGEWLDESPFNKFYESGEVMTPEKYAVVKGEPWGKIEIPRLNLGADIFQGIGVDVAPPGHLVPTSGWTKGSGDFYWLYELSTYRWWQTLGADNFVLVTHASVDLDSSITRVQVNENDERAYTVEETVIRPGDEVVITQFSSHLQGEDLVYNIVIIDEIEVERQHDLETAKELLAQKPGEPLITIQLCFPDNDLQYIIGEVQSISSSDGSVVYHLPK